MKSNIVLIGMTGSGKTTIGQQLSQRLSCPFIDIDHYIEETNQTTIPELFSVSEAHFREKEKEACHEIARQAKDSVISCGGGVVLNAENISALKETGWILLIDRPIEQIIQDIETSHRPLLKDGTKKLLQLYEERQPLYQEAADKVIPNQGTLEDAIKHIERFYEGTIQTQ